MITCCITNDIETTSIVNGGLREDTGIKVWKEGIPALLDVYDEYGVRATFFYIATFAKHCPDIVRMVQARGHEIACHGMTHEHTQAFDILSYDRQLAHLREAKAILEDIAGEAVVSFRAPALRVNKDTPRALAEAGFRFDSSVAPQRFDMFMSLGSKGKLPWIRAPRAPYMTASDNLARKGDSGIIEVPVSARILPYIGTFMRISPTLTAALRRGLYRELRADNRKVANFLIHPNEVITEEDLHLPTQRRGANFISYLLSDVLRRHLKQRNLGPAALSLFEKELAFWQKKGAAFRTICGHGQNACGIPR
ncbi:MAG: polysaccharide deacetylase family protein [Bacteroidales bacterium]|nr:polysaccharide deacetylase family protein [Bacteroidales bacterium]